jgi:hypothetical protein
MATSLVRPLIFWESVFCRFFHLEPVSPMSSYNMDVLVSKKQNSMYEECHLEPLIFSSKISKTTFQSLPPFLFSNELKFRAPYSFTTGTPNCFSKRFYRRQKKHFRCHHTNF